MSVKLSANETSIIIIVSEFNQPIIENLLQGAMDAFTHHGGKKSALRIYRVPGAFEIPGTIQQILKFHDPHAIVALGAVIRGKTPHFDYIAGESAKGISEISRNSNIPIKTWIFREISHFTGNHLNYLVKSMCYGYIINVWMESMGF